MRHLIIDTDTASDDAVALLMALREPSVFIEGITIVAGNCTVSQCKKNALVSIEKAGMYIPPVYEGISKPLFREHYTSYHIHGKDGMGDMNLPESPLIAEDKHAVDAIIDIVKKFPGEIEIITLGPLTNIAMAVLKEPDLHKFVKMIYIMGGAGLKAGNITPLAEFNIYVDAEAAHIVLNSGLPLIFCGWDLGMENAFINELDIDKLNSLSDLGRFAVRCNKTLIEFNAGRTNRKGFDLPDPITMAVALYPNEMIEDKLEVYGYVEYQSTRSYGHLVIDSTHLLNNPHNMTVVTKIKDGVFKNKLFTLLS
ncbi:Pyrimidine-specific ribonucleoside hydrolase RihB [Photorhabdus australis subsp. thailandensis]|uniref:Pyrimidine-specific ribonucleoside hydrolase RihB n=1 Tax=Photorhabdus australis subsp. thailandensis TaxID=2805096 RepID=A0A1C0U4B5_9GAMM|nr:nucleoside hydrolase [Photorhabdus australis]OCQ52772.1 Pyrimidine-specific ribonucleoside hydrolase RihB [Photorhabdus australis subsp. thailandensis]